MDNSGSEIRPPLLCRLGLHHWLTRTETRGPRIVFRDRACQRIRCRKYEVICTDD